MPAPHAILFVCLGNICRSPLAEGAFRAAASKAGIEAAADSAGTAAYHVGKPPDARAIRIARQHGIEIGGYRARHIEAADFARFTQIWAMDEANLADIEALRPAGSDTPVGLFLDVLGEGQGRSVADPYYGDEAGFARTWEEVNAAAHALVARLQHTAS